MDDLAHLADLLRTRNGIDSEIARIIGRPLVAGHMGEWVASRIFDVELHTSATNRGSDGRFRSGPLAGQTVNVKWPMRHNGLLDIKDDPSLDYFLVLTGPPVPPSSSRGMSWAWCVQTVFLFDAPKLIQQQRARGVQLGAASSVTKRQWDAAEIYPQARNTAMRLSPDQLAMLKLLQPDVMLATDLNSAAQPAALTVATPGS